MNLKGLAIVIALISVLSLPIIGLSAANTIPPFYSDISVPAYVTAGENFTVYVNDSLGFSNYTVTLYISGENMTGATPTSSYHNLQSTNPDFKVSIVAPGATQTLSITIVSGGNYSGTYAYKSYSYQINVIQAIKLYATLDNTGSVALHNVTVNFSVDGNLVGSSVASLINPGQSYTVNLTYVNPYLTKGEHTLTISVQSNAVTINGATSTYTTHFYYGKPPNYNWIFYVVAAVVIFMIFLVFSAGRRSSAPSRPKWRK